MTKAGEGRLALAVGLLSMALLALELALMQILSIVQWYHFAFLIISVALLGFGASGTVIALFRDRLRKQSASLLPLLLFACTAAMAGAVPLAQSLAGDFDIRQLFLDPHRIWSLFLLQLIFFVPFFLGALPIGLAFTLHPERINALYAANLIGSGLGGGAAVILMWFYRPEQLPALAAILPLIAGCLLLPAGRHPRWWLGAGLTAMVVAVFLVRAPALHLSPYKDLSRALNLPDARVTAQRLSPYGLVQAVSAPALRHAPDVSLTYAGPIAVRDVLFNNGDWFTAVPLWPPERAAPMLAAAAGALPYALARPDRVLVLSAASSDDAVLSLAHGAQTVRLVEPHRAAVALLDATYPASAGALLKSSGVAFTGLEPRTWLAIDQSSYDLIIVPMAGAFGGAAGLFALKEEYLLTKEGFRDLWDHLGPDGFIRFSAWLDFPARAPLRLAATVVEMLEQAGVAAAEQHVAAIRGWATVTILVKRSALTESEQQGVRDFCRQFRFDPLLLPGLGPEERNRFHVLDDQSFFDDLDRLLAAQKRPALYAQHDFNIRPATDNQPFFSQFLRLSGLPRVLDLLGARALPFLEMGYLIVFLTLAQMAAAAVLLILLPLLRLGWQGQDRGRMLVYFSCLGFGYMFVEMVFIHELVLYFGRPIYAAAAVLGAVLTFSGLGSFLSLKVPAGWAGSQKASLTAALLVLLWALLMPALVRTTMGLGLGWKALCSLFFIGPPALAMGFPFPLGLRALAARNQDLVGWAWGINGCVSVLSTALATITAVELGFQAVMLLAAAAYLTAAAASRIPQKTLDPRCR
ncbi:MAG: spermidine synthase-like protein [Thermodesulfobacteriota bacterium]